MSSKTAIATGYVALDVIRFGETVRQRAGGTAANVAAGLAYFGWHTSILGRLGSDAPGRRIRRELHAAGVDISSLRQDPQVATPVVLHEVQPPSHRFAFTCPECGRRSPRYAGVKPELVESELGDQIQASVVFADRITTGTVEVFRRAPKSLKMLEPSSRGPVTAAEEAVRLANVVKWSHELRSELHEVVFQPRAGQIQVETLGAGGLRFRVGKGRWRPISAINVEPTDTAGAGDWLTAAFLNALPSFQVGAVKEDDLAAALRIGQEVAALSCLFVGARTLSKLPLQAMQSAAVDLAEGRLVKPPAVEAGRRSRAGEVCKLCLGPSC